MTIKTRMVLLGVLIVLSFSKPIFAREFGLTPRTPKKFLTKKITFTVSDSWFSRDKAHHFLTSAFLTTTAYYVCREGNRMSNDKSGQYGVSFSLSLGVLKEIKDGLKANNAFSWKDLVADILGTAVGLALVAD